jgi:hypothetical protein
MRVDRLVYSGIKTPRRCLGRVTVPDKHYVSLQLVSNGEIFTLPGILLYNGLLRVWTANRSDRSVQLI